MRSHAASQQRISIGMRCRDARAPDRTTPSADILDDQGLSKNYSHLLGHDSRHNIARTSGGERHHHGDRSCRIIVPWPRRRRDTDADGRDAEKANERDYEELSAPHGTNTSFDHRRRINLQEHPSTALASSFSYRSLCWTNLRANREDKRSVAHNISDSIPTQRR